MDKSFPSYQPHLGKVACTLRREATFPERLLWSRLRRQQLGVRFLRQRPISHYIVDFYCPDYQLVIEVDGRSHDDQGQQDLRRQADLEALGVLVLRFNNDAVLQDVDAVVKQILACLEALESQR